MCRRRQKTQANADSKRRRRFGTITMERFKFKIFRNDSKARKLSFLHSIATGDKKLIHYDNPKKRNSWDHVVVLISRTKPKIMYYKLILCIISWSNIIGALHRTQMLRSKEKCSHYYSRQRLLFSWLCSSISCGAGQNLLWIIQIWSWCHHLQFSSKRELKIFNNVLGIPRWFLFCFLNCQATILINYKLFHF